MFLINLAVLLIFASLSLLLIYQRVSLTIEHNIFEQFSELAQSVEGTVKARLLQELAEASILASSPSLKELLVSARDLNQNTNIYKETETYFDDFTQKLAGHEDEYVNIVLYDPAGKALINLNQDDFLPSFVASSGWWQRMRQNRIPQVTLESNKPQDVIDHLHFNIPIWEENVAVWGEDGFLGSLQVSISLDEVFEEFAYMLRGKTCHAHILTVAGKNIIGGEPGHEVLFPQLTSDFQTEKLGQGIMVDETGHGNIIYSYIILDLPQINKTMRPQDRLVVFVRQSLKEVLQPARKLTWDIIYILFGLFLCSSLALNYYSGKLILPIEQLQNEVKHITRGHLDRVHNIDVNSQDEIGKLAQSFNNMATNLQQTMVSRDYLDAMFSAMDDIVFNTDLTGHITRVNRALSDLLKLPQDKLLSQSATMILDNCSLYTAQGVSLEKIENQIFEEEVNLVTMDKERIAIQLRCSPITVSDSRKTQIVGVVNVGRDVREYHHIIKTLQDQGNELQASEHKYHNLIETSPLATVICSSNIMIFANTAFEQLYGKTRSEFLQSEFSMLFPSGRGRELNSLILQYLADDAAESLHFETEMYRPDNKYRFIDLIGKRIVFEGQDAMLYLLNDITKRRELQQRVIQSERLSVVGTLAGGIAHEFNNIIGAMLGYAELAQSDPKHINKLIEVVLLMGERAKEITRGLLSFAKRQEESEEMVLLSDLIDEVLLLIEKQLSKSSIKLVKHYPAEPIIAFLSPAKLQQTILYILINAREAIGEKGVITIKLVEQEDQIIIDIHDTGPGIEPQNINLVFDPFFSTKGAWGKASGEGLGLGLTSAFNHVKSLGGEILVTSEVGKFTEFRIVLPCRKKLGQS